MCFSSIASCQQRPVGYPACVSDAQTGERLLYRAAADADAAAEASAALFGCFSLIPDVRDCGLPSTPLLKKMCVSVATRDQGGWIS